ncbi:carbohydrate kinase, partial [Rhizobium sp. TRM95111]|uniref:FGGY-family carbohydrate kinase n=1 Tax=Rhizobium alarense TaxID=2846851 RepID=UPI001EFF5197
MTVAVLDVGKTNVRLNALTAGGHLVETLSVPNPVRPAPPWRHHDLAALRGWVLDGLAALSRRHPLEAFVSSGHGSGGVLVSVDPDAGDGAALPMIDYEQPLPDDVRRDYAPLSGSFLDRGSALMHAATHQARQMFWMERAEPRRFANARWFLGVPQYWAWVLTGNAVSEATILGAQSHLWNVAEQRFSPIVGARGWTHLLPPFAKAWETVGTIRPELAERHGLPRMRVLAGGHDSSLNCYRYQAAGLSNFAVVSTGTWIVGLSDVTPVERLDEHRGMTLNSDVFGRPLGGALAMGGREFTAIGGPDAPDAPVTPETVLRLVARGTMALPSFGDDDGFFPGSAGRGRIEGPAPADAAERKALALVTCALLTAECLDALGGSGTVVLDGSFLRDPLYVRLVAA